MRIDRVKLVSELARRDMNLKTLSQDSGLSRATITAVKAGKSCSDVTAAKIANALSIDLNALLVKEA